MAQKNYSTKADQHQQPMPVSRDDWREPRQLPPDEIHEPRGGKDGNGHQDQQLAGIARVARRDHLRYRDFFDLAADAYIVSDAAGIIEETNPATIRLLNSRTFDLKGTPLLVFVMGENRRRFQRYLADVQRTNEIVHTVVRFRPFQHDPVDVALTARRAHERGIGQHTIQWILRDVTEEREAARRIHQFNAQLETRVTEHTVPLKSVLARERETRREAEQAQQRVEFLAEASRIFSGSLDREGTLERIVQFAVPYLADLCKIDLLDDEGMLHHEQGAHQNSAMAETLFARTRQYPVHLTDLSESHPIVRALRTGEPVILSDLSNPAVESSFQRPGRAALVRDLGLQTEMIVPLTDLGGIRGVITFALADSERVYGQDELIVAQDLARRASQALANAELYEEAATAARMRQQLLSVASHEMGNILTIIGGFAGEIDRHIDQGLIQGDHIVSFMNEMNDGIERLEYLVDDLSTAAALQQDRLELYPGPMNLCDLLQHIVSQLGRSPIRTDAHEIVVDAPASVAGEWDSEQLYRAMFNIVSNALKYSPDGGEVRVSVQTDDDQVSISTMDHGIGIAPADRSGLFEPFTRSENARNTASGTGLGLYITREIIERHGGTITIESEPGCGTTVTIRLPLPCPPAPDQ